jgi:hypothetical protein
MGVEEPDAAIARVDAESLHATVRDKRYRSRNRYPAGDVHRKPAFAGPRRAPKPQK